MEISGVIGFSLLRDQAVLIDYRNGVVKIGQP
jgi:hypothetical protein